MKRTKLLSAVIGLIVLSFSGCSKENSTEPDYNPVIKPENFSTTIDNPFFPLTPGMIYHYRALTGEGTETNTVNVTHATKEILGVKCVVVEDTVWLDGKLSEATLDWYSQDQEGNVWYFGEDSKEFENGVVISTEGSWKAGVDDAKPGIVMEGNPKSGDKYRQEYYEDEAEDMAQVISLADSASVPYGSYHNCLKTREWTPLESNFEENKYYAAGVGCVLEVAVKGGSERIELIDIEHD
jgi:hypothetical protein